jgi:hypothetical protein
LPLIFAISSGVLGPPAPIGWGGVSRYFLVMLV